MKTFFIISLALVLSACGQKGPLTLPDNPPKQISTSGN